MRTSLFSSILGLSIVAGTLASATPAHAGIVWRNFKTRDLPGLYMTYGSQKGNTWTVEPLSPLNNQVITFSPGSDPGFSKLLITPSLPRLGGGVSGGNMTNGANVITWTSNNDKNQEWRADYDFSLGDGSSCWSFYNFASPSNHVYVLSVAGANVTSGATLVISDYLADPTNHGEQFWCEYNKVGDALTPVPFP